MSSASGSCTPLPPATGGAGYYEATCNAGTKVEERPRSCFIRMVPDVTTITSYKYYVVPDNAYGTPFARRAAMVPHAASGVCKPTGVVKQACAAHRSEEHTSELQSLMRISYAVFCLKKKKKSYTILKQQPNNRTT